MTIDLRKRKVLRFSKKHRRMPSYRELANLLKLRSKSSAHDIAKAWQDEGFIEMDQAGRLVPGELHWQIPMLGTIDAGLPNNDELFGKSIALDDWLLDHQKPTYMIEVKGNSMKGAYIVEGDHVVVEKTEKSKPGDIVVARIDDAWTIKFLRESNDGKLYLQAASEGDICIHPTRELVIVAVVVAVIRRYKS